MDLLLQKIMAELPRWAQKYYAHVGNSDLEGEQLFEIVKVLDLTL